MPFAEDLSVFFNTGEHAVQTTIKDKDGVLVRSAAVIFWAPFDEMQVGVDSTVGHGQPRVQCRTADLAGVKKDYIFEIGDASYRFVRKDDDGTGVSVAFLRET